MYNRSPAYNLLNKAQLTKNTPQTTCNKEQHSLKQKQELKMKKNKPKNSVRTLREGGSREIADMQVQYPEIIYLFF